MRTAIRLWMLSWFVWSAVLVGCGGRNDSNQSRHSGDYPYQVVASVGMVADIVKQVAGERGEVQSLIGEGVDPHQHSPTRRDMRLLLEADVVFSSGLLLEGRMTENFADLQASGKPFYAVTDAIEQSQLRVPDGLDGHADPHVWMDVQLWKVCMLQIVAVLSAYDPDHADEYLQNAEDFAAELERLDTWARDTIETIPERQRILITAHDAFGYFGDAYGIEVLAPQGISTESEASVEDINQLVRLIVDRKIPAIFVESSVNPKSIKAIVEGAASHGHRVTMGGPLYSDAMGKEGTYEGTYIGMIEHNVATIVDGLGGTINQGGFRAGQEQP